MGTRFVATYECDADPSFKQSYLDARKEYLIVIKSPIGPPGRALRNQFLLDVESGSKHHFRCPYNCVKTCDSDNSPYCLAMALSSAKQGNLKNGFAFAGSNAFRVNKIVAVKELIKALEIEYDLVSA